MDWDYDALRVRLMNTVCTAWSVVVRQPCSMACLFPFASVFPVPIHPGKTSNDFKYLTTHAPAEDQDFTGLAEVQDAIRELGISVEEEKDVFKALGGLLHLGQVRRGVLVYTHNFPL